MSDTSNRRAPRVDDDDDDDLVASTTRRSITVAATTLLRMTTAGRKRKPADDDDDDDDVVTAATTSILRMATAGRKRKPANDDDDDDDDFVVNVTRTTVNGILSLVTTLRPGMRGHDDDDDDDDKDDHNDEDSCIIGSPGSLFYLIIALQMAVCLYSIVGNTVLFYKERKTLLWYNKRPLYLGVFIANALASLVHLLTAILRAIHSFIPGISDSLQLVESRMLVVADAAVVATVFSIAALTFASLYDIRRLHSRAGNYEVVGLKRSIFLVCLVWVLAGVFTLLGLGAHDERGVVHLPEMVTTVGHYGIITALQLAVGLALLKIQRYGQKLQTDFAVSRAQQNLDFRTLLKRVHKRTQIVVPLLAANVVLWIILLTTDVIVDNLTGKEDDDEGHPDPCERANQTWEALLDVLSIAYCALYPVLVSRNRAPIRDQLRAVCCFRYKGQNDVIETPNEVFERSNQRGAKKPTAHWAAMEQQWNRVAQAAIPKQ